jgi:hypothetical protein
MTQTRECAASQAELGAYVLGAIGPADRARVNVHLSDCQDCRNELAGLAGLPALLSLVTEQDAAALAGRDGLMPLPAGQQDTPPHAAGLPGEQEDGEPPRDLLAAVLDLAAARRRRRTWRSAGMAAAAAAVIVAAAVTGTSMAERPSGNAAAGSQSAGQTYGAASGPWKTAAAAPAGLTAQVTYRQMSWGTQLQAEVTGYPPGTSCTVAVVTSSGARVPAGGWVTDQDEGKVVYPASAGIPVRDIRAFVITATGHQSVTVPA